MESDILSFAQVYCESIVKDKSEDKEEYYISSRFKAMKNTCKTLG